MSNSRYIDQQEQEGEVTTPFSNYSTQVGKNSNNNFEENRKTTRKVDSNLAAGNGVRNQSGGEERGGDQFLDQAKDIEISNQDRQEGYDANLVNLQPRTTQSEVGETLLPLPSSENDKITNNTATTFPNQNKATKQNRKVELPYESRDPNAEEAGIVKNGNSRTKPNRRLRNKSNSPPWYQRLWCWIISLLLFLSILALSIGLGVGLTRHHPSAVVIVSSPTPTSNNTISSSNSVPEVSNSITGPSTLVVTVTPTPAV